MLTLNASSLLLLNHHLSKSLAWRPILLHALRWVGVRALMLVAILPSAEGSVGDAQLYSTFYEHHCEVEVMTASVRAAEMMEVGAMVRASAAESCGFHRAYFKNFNIAGCSQLQQASFQQRPLGLSPSQA